MRGPVFEAATATVRAAAGELPDQPGDRVDAVAAYRSGERAEA
ncbi:hypothetical protein ABZ614_42645 [Streptomyces sp. NPDC013178]